MTQLKTTKPRGWLSDAARLDRRDAKADAKELEMTQDALRAAEAEIEDLKEYIAALQQELRSNSRGTS